MNSIVQTGTAPRFGALDRFLRQRMQQQLAGFGHGQLVIQDALGTLQLGQADSGPSVTLQIHDPGFYRALATHGSVGAGQAYMDGLWQCSDLVALIQLLVRRNC